MAPESVPQKISPMAKKVLYVRYVLANATDAELKRMHLLPKERDRLLEKDVRLKKAGSFSPYEASFNSAKSLFYKSSCINFKSGNSRKFQMEMAAHEMYHAAKFWSDPKSPIVKLGVGIGLLALNSNSPASFAPLVVAATIANCTFLAMQTHKEEKNAYRFGYMFNSKCYGEDKPYELKSRGSYLARLSRLFTGYPTRQKIVDIYKNTAGECADIPEEQKYGLNYKAWKKDFNSRLQSGDADEEFLKEISRVKVIPS